MWHVIPEVLTNGLQIKSTLLFWPQEKLPSPSRGWNIFPIVDNMQQLHWWFFVVDGGVVFIYIVVVVVKALFMVDPWNCPTNHQGHPKRPFLKILCLKTAIIAKPTPPPPSLSVPKPICSFSKSGASISQEIRSLPYAEFSRPEKYLPFYWGAFSGNTNSPKKRRNYI